MRGALLLLALILAGCAAPAPSGDGASDSWALVDTRGERHAPTAATANATVLFFMATWCGSCRVTAPVLAEVQAAEQDNGVRWLSVGFDPSETPAQLEAWAEERAHPWPHGLDRELRVQRALGVTSQSSVVVLDAQGDVVERFGYGRVSRAGLQDALSRALGG